MAVPVMTKAAAGNLSPAAALPAAKNLAVYRDASAIIEDQVAVRVTTGGTVAATAGARIDVFYVYGSTSLSAAAAAGATSLSVASATGLAVGMKICVANEIRTISAISGTTVTIDALQNAQSSGAAVYLMTQTARPTLLLGASAANTTYSDALFLPTGTYVVAVTNTDAANAITAEVSDGQITSFS